MAIRRYVLEWDWKWEVVVDVDREIATDELLHSINSFWIDDDWRLDQADGDVLKAVLTMLCTKVLRMSVEHLDVKSVFQKPNGETEGWPPLDGSYGITLVRYDELDLDRDDVRIKEGTHG